MAFPAENLLTELLIDGQWTDVTSDVLGESDITISRGRANETRGITTSTLQLTFKDHELPGKYVNRNPRSPLYGKIGKNTPIRQSIRPALTSGPSADLSDTFSRTLASSWGNADSGQTYTGASAGAGGTSAVGSGVATHSIAGAVSYKIDYLSTLRMLDGVFLLSGIAAPQATGGELEVAGIMYRGIDFVNYGMVRVHLTTANVVQVRAFAANNSGQLGSSYTAGFTHTGTAQPFSLRVRVMGQTIAIKIWVTASAEPDDYQATFTDPSLMREGWIGIRTGRAVFNTNAGVTASYDALSLVQEFCRFSGEVPSRKPVADTTGRNVTVPITASGILRRLRARKERVISALERYILDSSSTRAYWALTDVEGSILEFNSGIGKDSLKRALFGSGVARFSAGEIAPTLASTAGSGSDSGSVGYLGNLDFPNGSATAWTIAFAVRNLNSSNTLVETPFRMHLDNNGTSVVTWSIELVGSSDTVNLKYAIGGVGGGGSFVNILASVQAAVFTGGPHYISASFTSAAAGASTDWNVYVDGVSIGSGTLAREFHPPYYGGFQASNDWQLGYFSIHAGDVTTALYNAYAGYPGELAATRFARLCAENGIATDTTTAVTRAMGPQLNATLYTLLEHIEDAEQGIISEAREFLGLRLTGRLDMYNQIPQVALAYDSQHLSDQLQPVDDDQGLINAVRATHPVTGEVYGFAITSGPNNTSDFADDPQGVGEYLEPISPVVNTSIQLRNTAEWIAHQGTIDEDRIPSLTVNLARSVYQTDGTLLAAVAGVDEGHIVTVSGIPSWLPPETMYQLIYGYTEVLSNSDSTRGWRIKWNTVPGSLYSTVGVYDAATSLYDSASSSTTGTLDTTQTSFTVTTTDSRDLWRTGTVSFQIMVGGEVMGVTNISGATSPQTFTVTRSVNGIVKTHDANTPVHIFRQSHYGL